MIYCNRDNTIKVAYSDSTITCSSWEGTVGNSIFWFCRFVLEVIRQEDSEYTLQTHFIKIMGPVLIAIQEFIKMLIEMAVPQIKETKMYYEVCKISTKNYIMYLK